MDIVRRHSPTAIFRNFMLVVRCVVHDIKVAHFIFTVWPLKNTGFGIELTVQVKGLTPCELNGACLLY